MIVVIELINSHFKYARQTTKLAPTLLKRVQKSIRMGDQCPLGYAWGCFTKTLPHRGHGGHSPGEIHFMELHNPLRAAQNLLHLPALRQLIHQLIQIPDLLRQRILDMLQTNPTDDSGDEVRIGV